MQKITLITLNNKMPDWVEEATREYTKRLQDNVTVNMVEIPLLKRGKSSDIARIQEKEMQLMKVAIPNGCRLIALDIQGESFSSEQLATRIERLQQQASHVCFIIGGPEGILPALLQQCDEKWSLSKLTLPHPLARIVLIEALYRAYAIIHHHPYHK